MESMNSLLGELGRQLGIPGLQADEGGYCALLIDQTWMLHLAYVEARASIQCMTELGPVPHEGREALLAELLHANALFVGTDGATLGLDTVRNIAVLGREMPLAGLDFVTFEKTLEHFVQQAEHWTGHLCSAAGDPPAHDEKDADPVAASAPAPTSAQAAGWLRG